MSIALQASTPNVSEAELARFGAMAARWWDPQGDARPLHDLNPVRLDYVKTRAGLEQCDIIDVGCGGGLLAEAMAKAGGRVLGIDLAPELIEVATLHAEAASVSHVEYRVRAVESLAEAAPASADVVTCMEMLEHVPDPEAIIKAIARLLRPGGHAIFSTLNRTPQAFAAAIIGAEYLLGLLPRGTHSYREFIRPSELAAAGRQHGLELVDVAGLSYNPFARRARLTSDPTINYLMHMRRAR